MQKKHNYTHSVLTYIITLHGNSYPFCHTLKWIIPKLSSVFDLEIRNSLKIMKISELSLACFEKETIFLVETFDGLRKLLLEEHSIDKLNGREED